jgi:ATP-dependent helicase/nuclease subunit B
MKLTPNRRLAIYAGGISLNIWLDGLYTELLLADPSVPYRLSSSEELVIWENIVRKSPVGSALLKTASTARLARDAWLLLVQWGLLPVLAEAIHTEDSLVFSEWVHAYQRRCAEKHWVDSATMVDVLIQAIEAKKITLPPEVILIGFEELTPQIIHFFEKVKAASTLVTSSALVYKSGDVCRLAALSTAEELKFSALKSKMWLEKNPKARIGIVVPDLEIQRGSVVRIFEETFPSELLNVSAPVSLSRYGIIDAAMLVLRFLVGEIPLEKFSRFLRSPFFGSASTERNTTAVLDVMLRDFSETVFSLENIIKKIEYCLKQEPKIAGFSRLAGLQKILAMRPAIQGKQSAVFWCERFLKIIIAVGWPGDRELTPEEVELVQQWQKLLADYVAMDRVLGTHRYSEALSYLQQLAENTAFAPVGENKTRGSAPIQVLGILEALGMPFDYLWVTGLHREAWPADPAPNPFIPLSLQRQYDLPRSSAARELKMAKCFTERLSEGAKEVIFSYPQNIEERVVSISPLLADYKEVSYVDLQLSKPIVNTKKYSDTLNFLSDQAPVVAENEKIKGGTQILKLQALCPFRAFAETRLQAKRLPVQNLGLNAAERGEIIHQVLDNFWDGINNQTELLAFSEVMLAERIHQAIEKVFVVWQARYPKKLTPEYLRLEKERTVALITRFILLEKTRPYFEVVSKEKTAVVYLENLAVKVRIDRIDRLADQSEILVDYKTGEVSISNWFGERPSDPQLPFYCITRDPKPAGIVFGVIRPDVVKYQGVTAEADLLPGVKTPEKLASLGCAASFSEQCDLWKTSINDLAREFMAGVARVDPLNGENTCRTCSLKPLCRVCA